MLLQLKCVNCNVFFFSLGTMTTFAKRSVATNFNCRKRKRIINYPLELTPTMRRKVDCNISMDDDSRDLTYSPAVSMDSIVSSPTIQVTSINTL